MVVGMAVKRWGGTMEVGSRSREKKESRSRRKRVGGVEERERGAACVCVRWGLRSSKVKTLGFLTI